MTTAETILARAMSMVGRGTVYWAGTGGLDPSAVTPAEPLAIGREWPRLPPDQQAALRSLAQAAGLEVDDPDLVAPACDCSGFVCWALGISRHLPATGGAGSDGWINTDSLWQDAVGPATRFRRLDRAIEGCLVVYPRQGSGERFGHVGLVARAGADGRARTIVHCSATNFAQVPHDAIQANAGEAFGRQPKTIYAWFLGAAQAAPPHQ